MKKIVVFASGSGSNFQVIVEQLHQKECEVAMLICDQPEALCLTRAADLAIPSFVIELRNFESKAVYERQIIEMLKPINPELIVLAGYMRIVGATLLNEYEGKIINIHPSLLPAFPGRDGIGDALKYGVKVMGVTVHYVDAGVDTGKIIDQMSFKRSEDESVEDTKNRIHALEHEIYPRVIKQILRGKLDETSIS